MPSQVAHHVSRPSGGVGFDRSKHRYGLGLGKEWDRRANRAGRLFLAIPSDDDLAADFAGGLRRGYQDRSAGMQQGRFQRNPPGRAALTLGMAQHDEIVRASGASRDLVLPAFLLAEG